jgi:hypothetical protein
MCRPLVRLRLRAQDLQIKPTEEDLNKLLRPQGLFDIGRRLEGDRQGP